jgi:hypothetical protein
MQLWQHMRKQDFSRDAAAYFVQWSSVPRGDAVYERTPLQNTYDLHTRPLHKPCYLDQRSDGILVSIP